MNPQYTHCNTLCGWGVILNQYYNSRCILFHKLSIVHTLFISRIQTRGNNLNLRSWFYGYDTMLDLRKYESNQSAPRCKSMVYCGIVCEHRCWGFIMKYSIYMEEYHECISKDNQWFLKGSTAKKLLHIKSKGTAIKSKRERRYVMVDESFWFNFWIQYHVELVRKYYHVLKSNQSEASKHKSIFSCFNLQLFNHIFTWC